MLDLVTESHIYNNYSYASFVDWEIEKTPETHPKKLEFNIDKPETDLKKIDVNINVNDNEINDINIKEAIYPSGDLKDDKYSNIENHESQRKRANQNNSVHTLVDSKLQLSPQLENWKKTCIWKTTNNHEGEVLMAYDNNAGSNILYPRTFYVLYIGLNNNDAGHLILNYQRDRYYQQWITNQYLCLSEGLITAINETDSFTTKTN